MTQPNTAHSVTSLPVPDTAARRVSEELALHIKHLIHEQGGKIGFNQFMMASLYQPGLGYYSAGSRKFGAEGDFVTAPEVSSIFSKCLARQCAQIINNLEKGIILELGAGTGIMARDILLELDKQDALPEEYWILEVSADLKQRQQQLINELPPALKQRVKWLDGLPQEKFTGLILANEVLDALPIHRFVKKKNTFQELHVGIEQDEFVWTEAQAGNELLTALEQLERNLKNPLPDTYVSEINMGLEKWLSALESVLAQGVMLFIDYGYTEAEYYHAERNQGTLLCHYRHRVHADPFLYPGLQDITASVDFTALAETADHLGLHVSGYTTQAYFLFGCALEDVLTELNALDIKQQTQIAQQVRTLTIPEEMGERFKVMALTKEYTDSLQGFSIMDQRVRL